MPNTAHHHDKILAELAELADRSWGGNQDLPEAIRSLVAAMEYNDPSLISASQCAVFQALRDLIDDLIKQRAGNAQKHARQLWESACQTLKAHPREDFDEVAAIFESTLEKTLLKMKKVRDVAVQSLEENGFPVPSAEVLVRDIDELEQLRRAISENWPHRRTLPPVDREMVARSRAERVLREGETFKDMVRRVASPRS